MRQGLSLPLAEFVELSSFPFPLKDNKRCSTASEHLHVKNVGSSQLG